MRRLQLTIFILMYGVLKAVPLNLPNNNTDNTETEKVISVRITSSVAYSRGHDGRRHKDRGRIDGIHDKAVKEAIPTTIVTSTPYRTTIEQHSVSASETHAITVLPPSLIGANIEFIKQLNAKKEKSYRNEAKLYPYQPLYEAETEIYNTTEPSKFLEDPDRLSSSGEELVPRARSISHITNSFPRQNLHTKILDPNTNKNVHRNSTTTTFSFNIVHDVPRTTESGNTAQQHSEKVEYLHHWPEKSMQQDTKSLLATINNQNNKEGIPTESQTKVHPEIHKLKPEMVYNTSKLADGIPEKIYSEPEKEYSEQAKIYAEPEKFYSEPAKVYSEPAKVYSEPAKVYGEPAKVYSEPAKVYGEPSKVYSEPAKFYSQPASLHLDVSEKAPTSWAGHQDQGLKASTEGGLQSSLPGGPINLQADRLHEHRPEQNYEVDEKQSVLTDGQTHGIQETSSESSEDQGGKVGYVVEGRQYRKYRVEERTSDGFIVGEYGVVRNADGALRGVRYTADSDASPRLIYDALMKFLQLQ